MFYFPNFPTSYLKLWPTNVAKYLFIYLLFINIVFLNTFHYYLSTSTLKYIRIINAWTGEVRETTTFPANISAKLFTFFLNIYNNMSVMKFLKHSYITSKYTWNIFKGINLLLWQK